MKYKIIRTDKADEQLREVIFYIADTKVFNIEEAGFSGSYRGKTFSIL